MTTETENDSERVAVATIAAATEHIVKMLQDGLGLEVSAKKSVSVGGNFGMATKIALASATKKVSATRRAKLLGTTAGGGRKRAVKFLAVRLTAFRKRVPRIQAMRRFGFSSIHLTKAAGIPVLTYGTETCGMSPSHLLSARRLTAKAVAPRGGGKTPDMVLHVADASGGTVDPAFDAHVLPIKTWALALWQRWQPHGSQSQDAR